MFYGQLIENRELVYSLGVFAQNYWPYYVLYVGMITNVIIIIELIQNRQYSPLYFLPYTNTSIINACVFTILEDKEFKR